MSYLYFLAGSPHAWKVKKDALQTTVSRSSCSVCAKKEGRIPLKVLKTMNPVRTHLQYECLAVRLLRKFVNLCVLLTVCVCVCVCADVHPSARSGRPGQGDGPAGPKLKHEEHQDPASHRGAQQCETQAHERALGVLLQHCRCTTAVSSSRGHIVKNLSSWFICVTLTGPLTWSNCVVLCWSSFKPPSICPLLPPRYRPRPPPIMCHVSRWGSSPLSPPVTLARRTSPLSPGGATCQLVHVFHCPHCLLTASSYSASQ